MSAWTLEDVLERCEVEGACWLWKQGLNSKGYPQARIDGAARLVASWVLGQRLGRPLRAQHVATSTCGHRLCVSPECLVELSKGERLRLAYARGERVRARELRSRRESAVRLGWTKLDMGKAREIRARRQESAVKLGQEFGVEPDTIRQIWRGVLWAEVVPAASVFSWGRA